MAQTLLLPLITVARPDLVLNDAGTNVAGDRRSTSPPTSPPIAFGARRLHAALSRRFETLNAEGPVCAEDPGYCDLRAAARRGAAAEGQARHGPFLATVYPLAIFAFAVATAGHISLAFCRHRRGRARGRPDLLGDRDGARRVRLRAARAGRAEARACDVPLHVHAARLVLRLRDLREHDLAARRPDGADRAGRAGAVAEGARPLSPICSTRSASPPVRALGRRRDDRGADVLHPAGADQRVRGGRERRRAHRHARDGVGGIHRRRRRHVRDRCA